MVVNEFRLVNNDNSKGIKFHWAEGLGDNITVKIIKLPLAGASSSSNYGRNWGGFDRLLTVDFILASDGSTDKSTDSASKVTLSQQWDYLMDDVIQGNSTTQSAVTFTLTVYRDGATKTYTGVVEDISLKGSTNRSNMVSGTLNFYIAT